MGITALAVISLLYLIAAVDSWISQKNRAMAGVFACYALANVLLIVVAYRVKP
jgi:hypothetical protein